MALYVNYINYSVSVQRPKVSVLRLNTVVFESVALNTSIFRVIKQINFEEYLTAQTEELRELN